MEKLIDVLKSRLVAFILPISLLVATLFPVLAAADGELALDTGHGGGGREGDPLDTNDAGGDGSSGDDIQDTAKFDGASSLLGRIVGSSRVLVIPQFSGNFISLRIMVLADDVAFVEADHAQ